VERTADGAIVTATIPAGTDCAGETPQGALFGIMRRALWRPEADEFSVDDAGLVCWNGLRSRFGRFGVGRGILRSRSRGILELAEFIWVRLKHV